MKKKTRTSRSTTRRRSAQPNHEGLYSQQWLERYGRTLTGNEIQLVQAHRGLAEPEQNVLRTHASHLVIDRAKANGAPTVAYAERAEHRDPGHTKLLDRRQFAWEMPGNIAYRRISRDNGDVFITERAPANLQADVLIDQDTGDAMLWIGVADPTNPPAYNACYAVIGGEVLQGAAKKILAASKKRDGSAKQR